MGLSPGNEGLCGASPRGCTGNRRVGAHMSEFYVVQLETYVKADDEDEALKRAREKLANLNAWNIYVGPEQEED